MTKGDELVQVKKGGATEEDKHVSIPLAKLLLLLSIIVALGISASFVKAPFAFGAAGDHALFHAFGHWIASGDVFIRDFIHFRTPGPYYYYALVQSVLGHTYFATSFALLFEAHVGQAVASFFLALAASRVFWGRASLLLAFVVGLLVVALPAIYQFRTAIPALALALYLFSLFKGDKEYSDKPAALFGTGCLLGLTYWFGQEIFVFLALSIGVAELSIYERKKTKSVAMRALFLVLGVAVVIAPGLLYFASVGVNLKEYFYITFYYAFFVQPKGMDIPFPTLSVQNSIFYFWLAIYVLGASLFALRGKLFTPAGIVFFSYIGLRLISMLGRADTLHLLFAISELFILLPIGVLLYWQKRKEEQRYSSAIIVLVTLSVIITFGVNGKSSALLLIPFVLLVISVYQNRKYVLSTESLLKYPATGYSGYMGMASVLGGALVVIFTYPFSFDSPNATLHAFSQVAQNKLLGVQVPIARKDELEAIRDIIQQHKASSIFSYPVRAEFYSFASKHGTRYVEFAPQTTESDVDAAIRDLKKNKPEIVIKDLDQAASLSPILHNLSDYISSAYKPITILEINSKIEILVPRDIPQSISRFFDNAYTYNLDRTQVTAGLRSYGEGRSVLVLAINRGVGGFIFNSPSAEYVEIKVYPEPGAATTGQVEVSRGEAVTRRVVSVLDGTVRVPVPVGSGEVRVQLQSAEPGKAVLWEDPKLVGASLNE